jgi:hypothetical protein
MEVVIEMDDEDDAKCLCQQMGLELVSACDD